MNMNIINFALIIMISLHLSNFSSIRQESKMHSAKVVIWCLKNDKEEHFSGENSHPICSQAEATAEKIATNKAFENQCRPIINKLISCQ